MTWHRSRHAAGRCQAPILLSRDTASVRVGDGIVHLDLRSDSYSCHYDPPATPLPLGRCSANAMEGSDDSERIDPAGELPIGLSKGDCEIRASDIAHFVVALTVTLYSFPGRSILSLLSYPRREEAKKPLLPHGMARQLSEKFFRMSLFLPFRPACLFNSFFLMNYLDRYGVNADWIFGVKLFPFEAHCWLEIASLPLSDRPDMIAFYTPILTISCAAS